MRLLLDTHALLWWWAGDRRLSAVAQRAIANSANEIFASAVSAWEIATKNRLGKLDFPESLQRSYASYLTENDIKPLGITIEHALKAGNYPQSHRDPFDRILAAQAEIEGLALVSRDRALRQFDVELIW